MKVQLCAEHNSQSENETVKIIDDALKEKPLLLNYIYSSRVIIDDDVQPPHSHPIITLNTRDNEAPELVISNFVHEQLHHFLHDRDQNLEQAVNQLKKIYNNVPIGYPDGANNEFWTYAHLILCALEQMIIREVFNTEYALSSLHHWQKHHYRWIYQTVESDYQNLLDIAKVNNLLPAR